MPGPAGAPRESLPEGLQASYADILNRGELESHLQISMERIANAPVLTGVKHRFLQEYAAALKLRMRKDDGRFSTGQAYRSFPGISVPGSGLYQAGAF